MISPGDITPITVNWAPWLNKTADTIYDFVGTADLDIHDSWFTETDCTLLLGPGSKGRTYTASYDIRLDPDSDEVYHREVKIRCR